METRKPNKGGRPALADPAKHRHVLYQNDRENARFLSQWEQSGVTSKSRFIAARLFGEPFRVVKVDKSDFQPLYEAGLSRAIGDWLLGMNATQIGRASCRERV